MSDAVVDAVSGALGGVVALTATYPLMTINTVQQTRVRKAAQPPPPASGEEEGEGAERKKQQAVARAKPPHGALAEMAALVRKGGWTALFSGLKPALIGTCCSQAVFYFWYSKLRAMAVARHAAAAGSTATIGVAESLLVSSAAGCINVLITNPIWLLATRMQADQQMSKRYAKEGMGQPQVGMLHAVREVLHDYGPLGFWNGVGASLLMVVNPTLQYALYEYLLSVREAVLRGRAATAGRPLRGPPPRPSTLEVFYLSALAKAGATVLTYPMLTVKTRLFTARKGDTEMAYTSVADAIMQIARKEGVGGYFKGLRTKIVQSVLAAALLFVAKDEITLFTRRLLASRRAGVPVKLVAR